MHLATQTSPGLLVSKHVLPRSPAGSPRTSVRLLVPRPKRRPDLLPLILLSCIFFSAITAILQHVPRYQCHSSQPMPPTAVPGFRTDFDPREGTFKACRNDPARPPANLRPLALWRSKKQVPRESVTLVTQLTIERMDMLEGLCMNWQDRLAAVVCVPYVAGFGAASMSSAATNGSAEPALVDAMFNLHRKVDTLQKGGCSLDLELVVQDVASWEDPMLSKYPVNAVRNRAIQLARGELVLLLDVDFMPSGTLVPSYRDPSAYDALRRRLADNTALVLPAFGHADFQALPNGTDSRQAADSLLLGDKGRMVAAYLAGSMPSFYEVENPSDHGPTNFTRWTQASTYYPIDYEHGFEPYVIVAKRHVPWFDERFIGYYRNKVSHLEYMYSLGVGYVVHPAAYVMHRPHLKSATFQATEALSGNANHFANMVAVHDSIKEGMKNGTYSPVTSFGHRCPPHVPTLQPVLAVTADKKKWARARAR